MLQVSNQGDGRAELVVVANRLPVHRVDGAWETSPGGLVSALMPMLQRRQGVWIGWPGSGAEGLGPFAHEGLANLPVPLSINGQFGEVGRVPVHYLRRSLPLEELVAHYVAADLMLVTPLRDGMNLVAKEYCAARRHDTGVLVLSEFCGAAHELERAVLVNPHDIDGLAATWAEVRVKQGKQVLELAVVDTSKGDAIDALRHRVGAGAVVYFGDDVTDEDAFARLQGPDVSVKVGPGASAASHRIADPLEVARRLARLGSPQRAGAQRAVLCTDRWHRRGGHHQPAGTTRRNPATTRRLIPTSA
jgi:hypothetical protein